MNFTMRCVELVKQFEGFRNTPYKDIAGFKTIGWGHKLEVGNPEYFNFDRIPITDDHADFLLDDDLYAASLCLHPLEAYINQNQFDALTSLVFNIGSERFRTSTLKKFIISEFWDLAADEFLRWDHVNGIEEPGLRRRREAERALFIKEDTT